MSAVLIADSSGSAGGRATGGGAPAEPPAEPSVANAAAGDMEVDAGGTDEGAIGTSLLGEAEGDSEDDENPVPVERVAAADLSEHDRKMESQLRAYLLEHRRKQEGSKGGISAAAAAAVAAATTATAATGSDARWGETEAEAEKADDGGFDIFNDDVEEAAAVEEAVDEAAMMDRGDNYDDKEGYYAHRVGDILNDRYKARSG